MQTKYDTGVLSWVTSGRCDLVADIRFPREDESEIDLSALMADLVEKIDKGVEALHPSDKGTRIPGRGVLSREALEVPKGWSAATGEGKVGEEKGETSHVGLAVAAKEKVPVEERELDDEERHKQNEGKTVSIDLDIRFKDLKASVPVRLHFHHALPRLFRGPRANRALEW